MIQAPGLVKYKKHKCFASKSQTFVFLSLTHKQALQKFAKIKSAKWRLTENLGGVLRENGLTSK